jgi:hypothetical protein
MKARTSKILFVVVLIALALLLSACKVNFITDLKSSGAGVYTQEIGFQADEVSMSGLSAGDEGLCANQNKDLPPGTTTRQETRNKDETWCIYDTPFSSLEDLKSIYGSTDMQVNEISLADGKMTYDVSLDMGSNSASMPMGAAIIWIVKMPGKVIENNATEVDGTNLKWTLKTGEVNNIRAVSQTGQSILDGGNTNWYIIGGAAMCMCCFVVIIIVGVVIFLVQRNKKNAAKVEPPAETPAP